MNNTHPAILAAETALADARNALMSATNEITARRRAEWIAAGGCPRCSGTGQMVTAAYSDETVYGPCTGYVGGEDVYGRTLYHEIEKNAHGYPMVVGHAPYSELAPEFLTPAGFDDRGYVNRWKVNRAIPCTAGDVAPWSASVVGTSDAAAVADLEESVAIAKDLANAAVRDWTTHKGARVVVKRGRKVPQGTEGVIMWEGSQRYGRNVERRVGIRVEGAADLVYTNAANVEVLEASADVLLPGLYGSDKQVSWASRIRLDAIKAGLDVDVTRTDARYWIDNARR